MRSGSLLLSRLVHLPLPQRRDGHLRQLQRAAGPPGLRVSPGPIRAQHHDRRRIAVQVDVLLPPNRPGFLGRTPAIRLTMMYACISEAGRRRSFNLAVPLQSRCYQGVGARRAFMVVWMLRRP